MAEVSRQRLWRSTGVLETVSAHPEQLLSVQEELASELSSLTKALFDFHKSEAVLGVGSPLNELITENFDEEQIWQQIELQNNAVLGHFKKTIVKTVKDKDLYILQVSEEEEEEESENANEEEDQERESEEEPEPISDHSDIKGKNRRVTDSKNSKKSSAVERFSDDDSDMDFDIDKLEQKNKNKIAKKPLKQPVEKSIVDDQFFKLSEMEAFLEAAEKEDDRDNEEDEEVDYFEDQDSDLDDDDEDEEEFQIGKTKLPAKSARDLQYEDYFDPVEGDENGTDRHLGEEEIEKSEEEEEEGENDNMEEDIEEASELDEDDEEDMMEETEESKRAKAAFKRVTFDLSDDSEGEDIGDILGGKKNQDQPQEPKSSFEKREEKMSEKIQTLQKQMLDEKSWQLSGEVTAQKRPENSLMSESLVFDHASRMAPAITEETTLQLEDIIKQRIQDQVWDDVVRKEKPKEDAFEYKKRLTLDHDKSKLSLAEIYEQEYVKLNQKKVEEEEDPKHVEIQKSMDSLFLKLDALSNFHFTPKPPVPEIKVVSNLPAISMEEVAPVGVSEAALLAPEEVKEKSKAGDLKTNAEKTATDKKRDRRKKKVMKKFKIKEKEKRQKLAEKQRAEKGKQPTKQAAEANIKKLAKDGKATVLKDEGKDKALKSSQAFFSQLQDQVKSQIKGAKSAHKNTKKKHELSAHKLKL